MTVTISGARTESSRYVPTPCVVDRIDTLTEKEKRFVMRLPEPAAGA
jgi:hypothetical protein